MSEQNATHVRPAKVFQFAGTLVGTLIGSGFASGQEVMQFFTSYGIPGIAGSLVTTALFAVLGAVFMNYGYKHAKSADFSPSGSSAANTSVRSSSGSPSCSVSWSESS